MTKIVHTIKKYFIVYKIYLYFFLTVTKKEVLCTVKIYRFLLHYFHNTKYTKSVVLFIVFMHIFTTAITTITSHDIT